jgi:hypothetical protein
MQSEKSFGGLALLCAVCVIGGVIVGIKLTGEAAASAQDQSVEVEKLQNLTATLSNKNLELYLKLRAKSAAASSPHVQVANVPKTNRLVRRGPARHPWGQPAFALASDPHPNSGQATIRPLVTPVAHTQDAFLTAANMQTTESGQVELGGRLQETQERSDKDDRDTQRKKDRKERDKQMRELRKALNELRKSDQEARKEELKAGKEERKHSQNDNLNQGV